MSTAIKIENVSKMYRLGEVGTGTIRDDFARAWAKLRGKEDPFQKVGVVNRRDQATDDDYVWALHDINFEVEQGEVLGIIGRNGAGKSTLLKLLSRITAPTTGRIRARGRIASLLEVGTGFHPELTGRENVYLNGALLGMTRREVTRHLSDIIDFSGCAKYVDTPVKRYSSGMMVRLGFAVAAHLDPEILIVDEVLAVGDAEFQKRCLGKMNDVARGGRTILFVSHNMAAVKALCPRSILLANGTISHNGNTDDIIYTHLNQNIGDQAVIYWPVPQSASDTDVFSLVKFRMADAQGRETTHFSAESAVHIDLTYQLEEGLSDFRVGFIVRDMDGVELFDAYHSDERRFQYKQPPGRYTIRCTIPERFLNPGKYSVSINAGIPNLRNFLFIPDVALYTIEADVLTSAHGAIRRAGRVQAPVSWSDLTDKVAG